MCVCVCVQVNVYKDPVTDPGKMSRKGRMTLELDDSGQYVTRTEGKGDPLKVGWGWGTSLISLTSLHSH